MPGQTFTLAEYPFDWIELACEKCGRHGKLRKARLMEQYGQIFRWQSYGKSWPNHASGLAACKTHAAHITSACSIGGRNSPTTLNQPRTNRDADIIGDTLDVLEEWEASTWKR